ncbi:MAG: hypothetical protein ACFFCW_22710 [Candidatus Hodarchaeota archaeon]
MGSETRTVSGLVIPVDWDDDGNIISAAIFDREEKQYVIKQDKMGKELLKLIRAELEVEGIVKKRSTGQLMVAVRDFWLKAQDDGSGFRSNLRMRRKNDDKGRAN